MMANTTESFPISHEHQDVDTKRYIVVKGAYEHNLKHIDVNIPRNNLVVVTGVSGSGKSSLVFDTIYAEGQRRYVESLSSYARRFLGRLEKPKVNFIEGLPPAISVEQRKASKNPRSIVATTTEIYDYLRLLFANIGKMYCIDCGVRVNDETPEEIAKRIIDKYPDMRFLILTPVSGFQSFKEKVKELIKQGYTRILINGKMFSIDSEINLDTTHVKEFDLIIDRLIATKDNFERIVDSIEQALKCSEIAKIHIMNQDTFFISSKPICPQCGKIYPKLEANSFSFNKPQGACPVCNGLGTKLEINIDAIIPDKSLTIRQGAIKPFKHKISKIAMFDALGKKYGFSIDVPWNELPDYAKDLVLWGTNGEPLDYEVNLQFSNVSQSVKVRRAWEGTIPKVKNWLENSKSQNWKIKITRKFFKKVKCPACGGSRLRQEVLAVKINDKSIADILKMTIKEAYEFFNEIKLTTREQKIVKLVIKELKNRLQFLLSVGLEYLTLDRETATLSGGEAQRVRLATQIGTALSSVLYVLDEPSIGLHSRDIHRLINTLKHLRDNDNTVLIVEHDPETIQSADYIIDLGPGAGRLGGNVVAHGTYEEIISNPNSITGQYLSGKLKVPIPKERREGNGKYLEIIGARGNNLKNLNVKFPLGKFICITGVSGSGKSTLINYTLARGLAKILNNSTDDPEPFDEIKGAENIRRLVVVDQSPIGRTARSNPATYTGVFDDIRKLFAKLPEAKARGYKPGRFSFNARGGRCEACQGQGIIKIEMHFLSDVYITCDVCKGKRFERETLSVKYKDKNIADVLDMTVEEAYEFFKDIPQINRKLKTLIDVGLGYITLGQQSPTLSGGEAQRVKLAKELNKIGRGDTLYILDEPTTGLSMADVHKLVDVLNRLVNKGNTVIVIEHNLDVIKSADYIIDLGPEGGDAGGYIVAVGTPEEIAKIPRSYTGKYLAKILDT